MWLDMTVAQVALDRDQVMWLDMTVAQVALDWDPDVVRYKCGSSGSRPGP